MQFKLSRERTLLVMAVLLVGVLPISLYLPEVPFILLAAASTVLALILLGFHLYGITQEQAEQLAKFQMEAKKQEHIEQAKMTATPEQRSAEDIIMAKLQGGVIEKAIDSQFDQMVNNIVKDLFTGYGGISTEIKKKLQEQMNPYIEKHDFAEHNVKLELLLNSLMEGVTKDQNKIIQNARTLMGLDPINEISVTQLFDKYCEHIGDAIETNGREIDYDDTPSYKALTAHVTTINERAYSDNNERKTLKFVCEDDEKLNIDVHLTRWTTFGDRKWHISRVVKPNQDEESRRYHDGEEITSLENPVTALKRLSELDVFLVKLHQDDAIIELDEDQIEDDSVEVQAEPEISLS